MIPQQIGSVRQHNFHNMYRPHGMPVWWLLMRNCTCWEASRDWQYRTVLLLISGQSFGHSHMPYIIGLDVVVLCMMVRSSCVVGKQWVHIMKT